MEKPLQTSVMHHSFGIKNVLMTMVALFAAMTTIAQNLDVYVAGWEKNEEDKRVAKVWKNGEELHTLTVNTYLSINCIFVSGNDVYVAGEEYAGSKYVAKVWKNGTELYAFKGNNGANDAYIKGLYVSGGDVYMAGYEFTSSNRVGWVRKNNEILYNLTNDNNDPSVSAMYMLNNDIYVSGRTKDSYGRYKATVWKNGNQLFTFGPTSIAGNYWSDTYDIQVSGNNIYVSGYSGFTSEAVIYRYNGSVNGIIHTYSATGRINPYAYAYSMDVVGNDVYAAVRSTIDKVYKNSSELYSFDSAKVNDISVKGGNIYLVGYESPTAKVWKNGEQLYALTDGTYDANANAIFIVERNDAGINDIQANDILFYPNPVKDELFIKGETGSNQIEIYDIAGKKCLRAISLKENQSTFRRYPPVFIS